MRKYLVSFLQSRNELIPSPRNELIPSPNTLHVPYRYSLSHSFNGGACSEPQPPLHTLDEGQYRRPRAHTAQGLLPSLQVPSDANRGQHREEGRLEWIDALNAWIQKVRPALLWLYSLWCQWMQTILRLLKCTFYSCFLGSVDYKNCRYSFKN